MALFISIALIIIGSGTAWFASLSHEANNPNPSPTWLPYASGVAGGGLIALLLLGFGTWWSWLLAFLAVGVFWTIAKEEVETFRAASGSSSSPVPGIRDSSFTRKSAKIRIKGSALDTIQFTYQDAEGDISHRRVVVNVVADEYFEGFCMERKAKRTFRLDRVIGEVVSESSGEITDAFNWANSIANLH